MTVSLPGLPLHEQKSGPETRLNSGAVGTSETPTENNDRPNSPHDGILYFRQVVASILYFRQTDGSIFARREFFH